MEKITRHVPELASEEKRVYESVIGHELHANQQIILHVITLEEAKENGPQQPTGTLPDWCNVYDGLSDDDIADLEKVILDRSNWSRSSQ